MKTGDSGVVNKGEVAASEADLLQGEPKGQQVGTHRQEKLQQEAAKKVVLGLVKEGTDALIPQLLDLSPASDHSRYVSVKFIAVLCFNITHREPGAMTMQFFKYGCCSKEKM